jgi:hypothetical protein
MASTTESASDLMLIFTVVLFCMSFIQNGTTSNYFWYLRSLQLIIHTPMFQINFPANVGSFFNILIPVVSFDIFSSTYTTEKVLEFDYDGEEEESNFRMAD